MRRADSHPWYFKGLPFLGMIVLVASGLVYRQVSANIDKGTIHVDVSLNLKSFPISVYGWDGKDLEIPSTTVSYMRENFADDYLSRRYYNEKKRAYADVYVVYCTTRPASIIGHKPQVCYVNTGWIQDEGSPQGRTFTTRSGKKLPCLIHRMHRPAGQYAEVVILNFYVVNGQVVTNEREFLGLIGRKPNIGGKEAKYVSQIQISSVYENNVFEAAQDMVDTLFEWLPDEEGTVKAAATSIESD